MTERCTPICGACIHLQKKGCKAFPKGIPEAIYGGGNNHHKPFPGDHGIQFECAPEMEPLSAVYLRDQM